MAYAPDALSAGIVNLQCQCEGLVAFKHLRHFAPFQQHFYHIDKFRHRDSIFCKYRALGLDGQLRALHLLFHVQVCHSIYVLHARLYLIANLENVVKVRTEHLYRNARPCA